MLQYTYKNLKIIMISEKQFWDLIERSISEKESIDKNEQGD